MSLSSAARRFAGFFACAALLGASHAVAQVPGPGVFIYYTPSAILQGGNAVLGLEISDPSGLGITGGSMTSGVFTYPSQVVNTGIISTNSCGASVTATGGASTFGVAGLTVPPLGICFIEVQVTTTTPGTYLTTFPASALSGSTGTNFAAPTATLVSNAPFVVTNTNDGGTGSLRDAIIQVNSICAGLLNIQFAIPGTGPFTIQPLTQLPSVACANTTIDGSTQPGFVPNSDTAGGNNSSIRVALNGGACTGCDGLQLQATNAVVRGLAIHSFAGSGIFVGAGSASISGNYIGTDPGGMTALGNTTSGVKISSGFVTLGSSAPGDRNLISANFTGVWILASGTATITNNQIGGKRDGSSGNGNLGRGILFNSVLFSSNDVSSNYVRYNGAAGIAVDAGTSGKVTTFGNSSYANGGIGIDYLDDGPTLNDEAAPPYDTDGVQNYPVITSVVHVGSDTVISGYLKSVTTTAPPALIQLYHNSVMDSKTEGEQLIDIFSAAPDVTGFLAFTRTIAGFLANNVTAAVTVDTCGDGCTRSSEYSPKVAAVAGLTLTPTSLPFATRSVSTTSPPQTVTLTNSGAATLTISSITVTGDFAFTSTCPGSLAVGATCTLDVTFTPIVAGVRTGALTIVSNAPGSPHSVALSGNGLGGTAPIVQVTPNVGDFAPQGLGTASAPQLFLIINVGNATLDFSDISVTGAGFTLLPAITGSTFQRCGAAIQSGGACAVQVTFDPPAAGSFGGVLHIAGNATNTPVDVPLVASGVVTAPTRTLSVPSSLAFPDQPVGTQSAGRAVTITNNSASVVSINGLSVTGDFSVSDTCTTIPAHGNCAPLVTFGPTALGARTGTLTIRSLSESTPYQVDLAGTGVFSEVPQITVSVTRLGFGNTLIGSPVTAKVVVTNVGVVPVLLQSVFARAPFLASHACPFSIPVHGTCEITVGFFPSIIGPQSGVIEIGTNAAGSPHDVQASGVGCAIPSISRSRAGEPVCGS